MRRILFVLCLMVASAQPARAQVGMLESGIAVTDPVILKQLQTERFSVGALLFPDEANSATLRNDELFAGPAGAPSRIRQRLKSIAETLMHDIETLPAQSLDPDARREFAGQGMSGPRFSPFLLNHPKSTFVLTG